VEVNSVSVGCALVPRATARAQETPKVDIFAGYSYLQVNPGFRGVDSFHLHGGSASVAYNVKSWLGGVADFGAIQPGHRPGHPDSGTLGTLSVRARVSYRHFGKITPFGQVLFGTAHANRFVFGTIGTPKCLCHDRGRRVDYRSHGESRQKYSFESTNGE